METMGIHRNVGKRVSEIEEQIALEKQQADQEKIFLAEAWWKIPNTKKKEFSIPDDLAEEKNSWIKMKVH